MEVSSSKARLVWYSIDVQLCSNYPNRIFYASTELQTLIRVIDHKFRMIGDMHFELIGSIIRELFVISGKLPSSVLILTDSKVNYNVTSKLILNFLCWSLPVLLRALFRWEKKSKKTSWPNINLAKKNTVCKQVYKKTSLLLYFSISYSM